MMWLWIGLGIFVLVMCFLLWCAIRVGDDKNGD